MPAPFEPYVRREEPGERWYCRCTRSKNQPYCDGSHKGTEFEPIRAVIDREKTVAWCACRRSAALPFCDGTHARLNAEAAANPDETS